MTDLTFQGIWRMDWGFGNPNKTAAFIAILMIAVWALAYVRRWGFWVALAAFIGLGVTLIHTFSRGGVIAVATGIIVLLIWAPRPWPRSRWIAGLVGFWMMIGISVYLKAHQRYTQGVTAEDRSISNRLQLWKSAPAMMVNSSEGWGLGNAGNAYVQWYQPLAKNESYRTLVNSHLTWLVEFGWPMRVAYLLAWISIFVLCWPSASERWRSIAFGVWLCFFTAAFFSSVAESPVMWIIPGLFLAAVIGRRVFARQFPSLVSGIIPLGATAALVLAIWSAGQASRLPVRGSKPQVVIGPSEPKIWICYDATAMGNLYGKSLRAAYGDAKPASSVGLLFPSTSLPPPAGKILILGSTLPAWPKETLQAIVRDCAKLVLLNPRFSPQEIGIDSSNKEKVQTYFGVFSQSPQIEAWQPLSRSERIAGAGDFLPGWASLVLSPGDSYAGR